MAHLSAAADWGQGFHASVQNLFKREGLGVCVRVCVPLYKHSRAFLRASSHDLAVFVHGGERSPLFTMVTRRLLVSAALQTEAGAGPGEAGAAV